MENCGNSNSISNIAYENTDLTGQRFAHLTAMKAGATQDHRGSAMWHCRCDCGNEMQVSEYNLKNGYIGSCGCRREDIGHKTFAKKVTYIDGACIETLKKRKCRRDNKSGFRGVFQVPNGSYRVSIGFHKKRYYLGYYSSLNEAIRIRLRAEEYIHGGFLDAYRSWEEFASDHTDWAAKNPFEYSIKIETPEMIQAVRSKYTDPCRMNASCNP